MSTIKVAEHTRNICGLKGHSSNIVPPLKGKDHNTVFLLNDTNKNTSTALENFPLGPTQTKAIFTLTHVKASDMKNVLKSLPSKYSSGTDNREVLHSVRRNFWTECWGLGASSENWFRNGRSNGRSKRNLSKIPSIISGKLSQPGTVV